MTDRPTLLRAVAACAPKEWKAIIGSPNDPSHSEVLFGGAPLWDGSGLSLCVCLGLRNDVDDGPAVALLLSHLESKGYQYSLSRYDDPNDPGKFHISIGPLNDDWGWERESFSGESLGWVVSLAFVGALGGGEE